MIENKDCPICSSINNNPSTQYIAKPIMSRRRRNLNNWLITPSNISRPINHTDIEDSIIEGELHFFFSVDMKKFLSIVDKTKKDKTVNLRELKRREFEQIQYSYEFADALRNKELFPKNTQAAVNSENLFYHILWGWEHPKENETQTNRELRSSGFDNGIFGAALANSWLNCPTFRLVDGEKTWFIRCSWLGLFEVHLIKKLGRKDENYEKKDNFVNVMKDILENRTRMNADSETSGIWNEVFDKINIFCGQSEKFEFEFNSETIKFRQFKPTSKKPISIAERQRYVVVAAKRISCSRCGERLPAQVLNKNNLLSALLYSSLVSKPDKKTGGGNSKKTYKIPDLSIGEVKNLSTWNNEICAFGSERGFIYYNPDLNIEENPNSKSEDKKQYSYDYNEYWQYIMRGVQHTVTIKATLQSLQTQIRKLTDKLPEILVEIDESNTPKKTEDTKTAKDNDENVAHSLANILQIMPQINSICIPSVAFKANYAVDKFKYLNEECFGFKDVLNALRRDVRDVSAFLEFSKSHQQQIEIEKRREEERERKITELSNQTEKIEAQEAEIKKDKLLQRVAVGAAFFAALMVGPTFANDLAIVIAKFHGKDDEAAIEFIAGSVITCSIILLILLALIIAALILSSKKAKAKADKLEKEKKEIKEEIQSLHILD